MKNIVDMLFFRTWWLYQRDRQYAFSEPYHWFNIFEGCVWLLFAGLVLARHLRNRHSQMEFWYALAFFTFGLSDFREAWVQSSPLLWFKFVNLIALFYLRYHVLRRYYPDCKLM